MAVDPEKMERAFLEQRADMMVMHALVSTLIDAVPNRALFAERFQSLIESYGANAPPGTDPEMIVEIRARADFWLRELASPYQPI
jgi:hypothetical protein